MKTDTCRQALRANEQRFYLLQYARCLIFFRNVMNYRDNKNKFQLANTCFIQRAFSGKEKAGCLRTYSQPLL